jgi:hypothetical protein
MVTQSYPQIIDLCSVTNSYPNLLNLVLEMRWQPSVNAEKIKKMMTAAGSPCRQHQRRRPAGGAAFSRLSSSREND